MKTPMLSLNHRTLSMRSRHAMSTRVPKTRTARPLTWLMTLLTLVGVALTPTPAAAQSEVVEYYATDALGSTRVVFDAAGNVKARSDYLPFGEAFGTTGNLPAQRFTGQERDGEAGLDNFNARSLAIRVGRFGGIDPAGGSLTNPQTWNRYAYVLNNPLALTDPTGMAETPYRTSVDASCNPASSAYSPKYCPPTPTLPSLTGVSLTAPAAPDFSGGSVYSSLWVPTGVSSSARGPTGEIGAAAAACCNRNRKDVTKMPNGDVIEVEQTELEHTLEVLNPCGGEDDLPVITLTGGGFADFPGTSHAGVEASAGVLFGPLFRLGVLATAGGGASGGEASGAGGSGGPSLGTVFRLKDVNGTSVHAQASGGFSAGASFDPNGRLIGLDYWGPPLPPAKPSPGAHVGPVRTVSKSIGPCGVK